MAPKTPTELALKLNPGISNWTDEEDRALKEALSIFASFSGPALYAKIAAKIGTKRLIDVALRVKWMNEQGADLSIKSDIVAQSNILKDDDIYLKAIGGTAGPLLEQNKHALSLIEANLASVSTFNLFQVQDNNINLFSLIIENVSKVLNDTNIKPMPPFLVRLKDINILP